MKTTKANNRINLSILSIAFIVLLVSTFIIASFVGVLSPIVARAYNPLFDGGTGTQEDPYLVSNSRQLNNVRYNLDSYFLQTDNIDASDIENFTPIGSSNIPFAGNYNGKQFLISNITIDNSSQSSVGLFSYSVGTVSGIKLYDSTIVGENNVGGIVGVNLGIVKDSTNQARLTGKQNVGGFVGLNQGIVESSVNSGQISIDNNGYNVGGIVGLNFNTIKDAYNLGNITGGTYVGGVVGSNNNQNGTASVSNSYNYNGSLNGKARGQIAGENTKSSFGYGELNSLSWLQSQPDMAAAFGGTEILPNGNINQIAKNSRSLTVNDFATRSVFSQWNNFSATWQWLNNARYPTLISEYVKVQEVSFVGGNAIQMQAEQTGTLKVVITPKNATLQDAIFEINQGSSLATVDKYTGDIMINDNTPVGSIITINAKVEDIVQTLTITTAKIGVVNIEDIKVQEDKTVISYGEVLHLSTRALPLNASFNGVQWRTSVGYAEITDKGELKLNQDIGGDFEVIAQSVDNSSVYTQLQFSTAKEGPGYSVVLDNAKEFFVDGSLTLNPKIVVTSDQNIDKQVRLEIVQEYNYANATLQNNILTAITAERTVTIRAFVDSMHWDAIITVNKVAVQKVEFINQSSILLRHIDPNNAQYNGLQIVTKVSPQNATYPTVTLSIQDNTANATLDTATNILSARRVGTVTIQAVADGMPATIVITVLANPVEGLDLQLSDGLQSRVGHIKQDEKISINLTNNGSNVIRPIISPSDATYDFGQDIKVYYEVLDRDDKVVIGKTLATDIINNYFKYTEVSKEFDIGQSAPVGHTIKIFVEVFGFSESRDFKIDFYYESDIKDSTIADDGLFSVANMGDKIDGLIGIGDRPKVQLKLLQYEISILNANTINFTRTIQTSEAKVWLLLYRNAGLNSNYTVSIKMTFEQNGVPFDISVGQSFGMQTSPTDQVDDFNIKQNQSYPAIVSFDFYQSSAINFDSGKPIKSNSKLQAMYVYGNSNIQYTNLRFDLNQNNGKVELYLNRLNFIAPTNQNAITITSINDTSIYVLGNITIRGGSGSSNGDNGKIGIQ